MVKTCVFGAKRRKFRETKESRKAFHLRRNHACVWAEPPKSHAHPEDKTVMMELGKSMEYQLTMSKDDFSKRFLNTGQADEQTPAASDQKKDDQAYRFLKMGRFMMRSQLDAIYQGQVFDVKTRAVFDVRHDARRYEVKRKYRITKIFGGRHSYELEIYEMMRNAFMKYGFQAKIGRMDGVIVAYHNTAEVFGFQYLPLADMERCIYGGREAANVAFDLSVKVLQTLLDFLTQEEELSKNSTIKMT
ncbi:pet127, partial [Symbiodinium pilosum]